MATRIRLDHRRAQVAGLASIGFVVLLAIPQALGSSIVYLSYGPPFITHPSHVRSASGHSSDTAKQTFSLGTGYVDNQSSGSRASGNDILTTIGLFQAPQFVFSSSPNSIHYNNSGMGTGSAYLNAHCSSGSGGGGAANYTYSIEFGLWDATGGAWVSSSTQIFYSMFLDTATIHLTCTSAGSYTQHANLTVSWSLGASASLVGLNISHRFSLQVLIMVETHAVSSGAGQATAVVGIAVTPSRIQAYYS